jgi:hypothetical protein
MKENIEKVAKAMKIPIEEMLWNIRFYALMILNIHELLLVCVVSLKWLQDKIALVQNWECSECKARGLTEDLNLTSNVVQPYINFLRCLGRINSTGSPL